MKPLLGIIAGALLLGGGCAHSAERQTASAERQTASAERQAVSSEKPVINEGQAGTGGGGLSCEVINSGKSASQAPPPVKTEPLLEESGTGGSGFQSDVPEETKIDNEGTKVDESVPEAGSTSSEDVPKTDVFEDTGMGGSGGGGG